MDRQTNRQTGEQTIRCKDRQMDGQIVRYMDGQTDRVADREMDRQQRSDPYVCRWNNKNDAVFKCLKHKG